jgi:hypothetical protein
LNKEIGDDFKSVEECEKELENIGFCPQETKYLSGIIKVIIDNVLDHYLEQFYGRE